MLFILSMYALYQRRDDIDREFLCNAVLCGAAMATGYAAVEAAGLPEAVQYPAGFTVAAAYWWMVTK